MCVRPAFSLSLTSLNLWIVNVFLSPYIFSLCPSIFLFHKWYSSLLLSHPLHPCLCLWFEEFILDAGSGICMAWGRCTSTVGQSVRSMYTLKAEFSREWGGGMEMAITHTVNRHWRDAEGHSQVCLSNNLISWFYSHQWQQPITGSSILLRQKMYKWTTGLSYNSAMEWEIWKNNPIIIYSCF